MLTHFQCTETIPKTMCALRPGPGPFARTISEKMCKFYSYVSAQLADLHGLTPCACFRMSFAYGNCIKHHHHFRHGPMFVVFCIFGSAVPYTATCFFSSTICLKSFGHLSLITIECPHFVNMIYVVFVYSI